ncbi:MAG: ABC transporter substrate-binding protein [Haloarculaceae archaeon]
MSENSPTVVSTTPSGTEILFELGVEPAAVSHACDWPPRAADLPAVDSSRVDADRSRERDEQATGDIYDVDVGLLREVAPDLVVTQSVCGVCAVDEQLVETHLSELQPTPECLPLSASDLAGVAGCIHEVGAAVGRPERAETVVDRLETRVDRLDERTATVARRPSVVVLEWMDPLHVAANWVPELVQSAGGRYRLADAGERSRQVDWEEIRVADPDVLVVAPCSSGPEWTRERRDELRARPGWEDLRAVETGQVYAFDGQLLSRWTPRLGDALEGLASVLHPGLVDRDSDVQPLADG